MHYRPGKTTRSINRGAGFALNPVCVAIDDLVAGAIQGSEFGVSGFQSVWGGKVSYETQKDTRMVRFSTIGSAEDRRRIARLIAEAASKHGYSHRGGGWFGGVK